MSPECGKDGEEKEMEKKVHETNPLSFAVSSLGYHALCYPLVGSCSDEIGRKFYRVKLKTTSRAFLVFGDDFPVVFSTISCLLQFLGSVSQLQGGN